MAGWGTVVIKPGVNVQATPTLNEAGISQSALVRWRNRIIEKLGGWAKFYPFTVTGVPKQIHAWADLNNVNHLGVGTSSASGIPTGDLSVITNGAIQEITPQTLVTQNPIGTAANQIGFSTTINTPTVVVYDGNTSGLTTLDSVYFNTPVYIPGSGVVLAGLYPIQQINGVNTYQITAAMNATATVAAGSGQVPKITTTAGSPTVSVEIDAHGLVAGQQIILPLEEDFQAIGSIGPASTTLAITSMNSAFFVRSGKPVFGTGVTAGTVVSSALGFTVSSGTYNSGTGAVSLTLAGNHGLVPGASFNVAGLTGTGSFASLDGTWIATGGTSGTTLNYTAPTGLTLTITGGGPVAANGGIGLYTVNNSQTVSSETLTIGAGVTLNGAFTILTIVDANDFTINSTTLATATATYALHGNEPQLTYYLNLGPPAVGAGYGLGGYGLGGYGTGVVPASQTGTAIQAVDWTLGNWGEILISCPKNGGLYSFDPTGGFSNAGLLAGAPLFNTGMFIAMPQQQIVAFGSTVTVGLNMLLQDPMYVGWCDVSNFNVWTATPQNQAGHFRLSPGSMIVGGRSFSNNGLLWTDVDLWTMTYLGPPLVWGFNKVNGGAGLIALRAHCELAGTVYWQSQSNFHQMGPQGVGILPCTVWDAVFQNLNKNTDNTGLPNTRKCWAWANTAGAEVWFFFPSANGNGECDSFAKMNQLTGDWDYYVPGVSQTAISRSCGINQSVLGQPIATTPTGLIYQHEISPDADGQAINWSYTTGYFKLADGEDSVFVDQVIPDFKYGQFGGSSQNAAIQITFNLTDDPNTAPVSVGPFTVMAAVPEITDLRLRARLMSITFSGNDVGTFSRLGSVRYRWAPDGKHP